MSNSITYVTQPGSKSYTIDDALFDVGSNVSLNVNGSNNRVLLDGSGETITLNGGNNVLAVDANSGAQRIQYGTAWVQEDAKGNFSYSQGVNAVMSYEGILSFALGNGNYAYFSNVAYSGSTRWASGTALTTISVQQPGTATYTLAGASFNVGSGETLNLTGLNDKVVIEGSGNTINLSGESNAISFSANNGAQTIKYGSAYVLEDANGNISYSAGALLSSGGGTAMFFLGDGNIVTVSDVQKSGANISASGALGPVKVTQAGSADYTKSGATFDVANNVSMTLTGSTNHVNLQGSGDTLTLYGGNNYVSLNASNGLQTLQYAKAYVKEDAKGNILYSQGALLSVSNGVALLSLGDGNLVRIANVQSSGSTIWAAGPVNQLVSAMAAYAPESAGTSTASAAQSQLESSLLASSLH
jgi:hypothetical protein